MTKSLFPRVLLALLALALFAAPADAQRRGGGGGDGGGGGFFGGLFGPSEPFFDAPQPRQSQPRESSDYSRAPAPAKSNATPSTTVVVMGDSMADWLAYGLEDALAETPEIGVVRKHKTFSGLIRYEPRSDTDWAKAAREILSQEKANFVVMMLGLNDRTTLREPVAAKPAPKAKDAAPGDAAKTETETKEADNKPEADEGEQISIVAPEPGRSGSSEFRSDRWAELYTKKIDETLAALKSKGVPVFWVGLPSIKGTRSTSDAVYLNDLFRGRAEKAGVTYIDIWDGFVDEGGRYAQSGPDFEGQNRRLRSYDGVHFTKAGARKLAHYVEREIRRFMSGRGVMPVALPTDAPLDPMSPDTRPGAAARPLAGPVVPLNGPSAASEELLGAGPARATVGADQNAARVLVKGDPVTPAPGRADDFAWPRGQAAANESIAPAIPLAEPAAAPAVDPPNRKGSKAQAQATPPKSNTTPRPAQQQARPAAPPPPQARSNDPFGWFR